VKVEATRKVIDAALFAAAAIKRDPTLDPTKKPPRRVSRRRRQRGGHPTDECTQ